MRNRLFLVLIGLCFISHLSYSQDGPFGFKCGMTKEQVAKIIGDGAVKETSDDLMLVTSAPKPHDMFAAYFLTISPANGLLKLVGLGRLIQTNGYGYELIKSFAEIQNALRDNYGGATKIYDFLSYGSIWNEPKDFMMALKKKDRTLVATWDLHSSLPLYVNNILLQAEAESPESGRLSVAYEFEGYAAYSALKKAKANKVF